MTYTFDEALNKLRELSQKGADTWYGDQLEKRTNVKGHLEAGDVEVIINKLRKEYAPAIEMTSAQREYWEKANENNFKTLDKKTTSGLFVADMPDKKNNANINGQTVN